MRKIIFILSLFTSTYAFAQKTDYTGTWLINKHKTDFAVASVAEWTEPRTIKIDQHTNKLTLTRTLTDSLSVNLPPREEVLSFDGAPFRRAVSSSSTVVTTLHWLNDQSFKVDRKGTLTTAENWTLTDGGKTLVIDQTFETPEGYKYTIKCYYDKQ